MSPQVPVASGGSTSSGFSSQRARRNSCHRRRSITKAWPPARNPSAATHPEPAHKISATSNTPASTLSGRHQKPMFACLKTAVDGLSHVGRKAVTQTTHRQKQHKKTGRHQSQAQATDVDVDRAFLHEHVVAPHLVEQQKTQEDTHKKKQEEKQQAENGRSQF